MNTERIGQNAGIIWNILNVEGVKTGNELKKHSRLTDIELYTAIGWLAREGKLIIANDTYSLV